MSRHDHLIDQLFSDDASRTLARNFVSRYETEPQMADRIEPLLREAASANERIERGEITAEQGREFMGSFAAEALGTPGHLVGDGIGWLESGGQSPEDVAAHEQAVVDQLTGPLSPEAKAALAEAERGKARQECERIEKLMQAPEYSAEWKSYWQNPRAQAEYREALAVAHGVGTETPGDLTAPPAAAATPATPTPAPGPTAPVVPASPAGS
jgi:hypothetical protein